MRTLQLPRLGQTMERGRVVRWLKQVGDQVVAGEPLYEVESEKAVVEVEATAAGQLVHISVGEDDEVDVGTLMGVLADPGEHPDPDEVARFLAAGEKRTRARVLPRARALARELGVDLASVTGTLPDGAVGVEDVERARDRPAVRQDGDREEPGLKESRRLAGTALAMAEAVTRSWREVPQFVQIAEIDLGDLAARASAAEVTITDLVLRAIARAAVAVPLANSRYRDGVVDVFADVNVALAVASDRGLVAPVLRRVQDLDVAALSRQRSELVARARDGKLQPADLAGATITFSNLGRFGVDTGTPLVVEGQSMIVFMGSMQPRPVIRDGRPAVATTAYFSLGCDHRVLDGAAAAGFLAALRAELEGTSP